MRLCNSFTCSNNDCNTIVLKMGAAKKKKRLKAYFKKHQKSCATKIPFSPERFVSLRSKLLSLDIPCSPYSILKNVL